MAVIAGLSGVCYRSTNGRTTWPGSAPTASAPFYTGSAPNSLVAMGAVANVDITIKNEEGDVSVRASRVALSMATLQTWDAKIDLPFDPTNADVEYLLNALTYGAGNSVALAIFDSAITTGVQGLWADFTVLDMAKTQNQKKEQRAVFTVKPTNAAGIYPQAVQSS